MSRKNMFYWQSDRPYTAEQINQIFLERKTNYSQAEVSMAAAHAMGEPLKELFSPIDQGSVNIVCPFTTISGKEGVIRVHPPQVRNEYFYAEALAMQTAQKVGIPVPEIILVDDSRRVAPFDFMVMTRVSGEVMRPVIEKDPSLHPEYLRQLGVYLGQLHTIKTTGYGFFDNELARNGKLRGIYHNNQDHFLAALDLDEKFHRENPGQLDAQLVDKSLKVLRMQAKFATCDQPTLVHNDIADWNTVVQGKEVTGILDWDECFSGDPVFEFATLSLFYSDEQMEIIKSGYQESNNLPKDYKKKFDLYVMRYIINKSKIAITKIKYAEKTSMRDWLDRAKQKLIRSNQKLTKILTEYS